jgi:hypothetical protein
MRQKIQKRRAPLCRCSPFTPSPSASRSERGAQSRRGLKHLIEVGANGTKRELASLARGGRVPVVRVAKRGCDWSAARWRSTCRTRPAQPEGARSWGRQRWFKGCAGSVECQWSCVGASASECGRRSPANRRLREPATRLRRAGARIVRCRQAPASTLLCKRSSAAVPTTGSLVDHGNRRRSGSLRARVGSFAPSTQATGG